MLKDFLSNAFLPSDKYRTHSEAVIISCFFNPQNSPYRLSAFNRFYEDIKHLNHRIIELSIGNSEFQLEPTEYLTQIRTESLLWHKESLLNKIVSELPAKFKYVFWVDADVIFTNKEWLTQSVDSLKNGARIVQPFEFCFHLEKDKIEPSDKAIHDFKHHFYNIASTERRVWRSFAANCATDQGSAHSNDYNAHGHVGFAWGCLRSILDECPLYDRALIGGADHIIAHAANGQIPCECITKSFTEDIQSVNEWSLKFSRLIDGQIDFVEGLLYHLWHGDIAKRQYLKRIQDFTPIANTITERDSNGLFVAAVADAYMSDYFESREVGTETKQFDGFGGGQSGGAGGGADWGEQTTTTESKTSTENFS